MSVKIDKKDLKSNQFKKEWSTIKLKDICEKGKEKNKNTTIDIVFSNSALNGIVEQSSFFYKDIANRENLSTYFIVNKDDFVYNPRISSLAPCGPINRNKSGKKGVVSPLYTVFNLKNNKCELDYLEHYFKSSCWYKYMYSIANYGARSDRMNVTDSDFFNMELSLPPIEEQQKIASILSTWDKAIELKEKLIEQKKEQKKGLMQKLLTGEVRLPGFKEKWKKVKIKDLSKVVTGTTPSTSNKNYYQDGVYPWITPTDITESKYISSSARNLTNIGLEKGRFVPAGSLLITCIASIGKNAILTTDGSCNQQINAILPSTNHSNEFLYYRLTMDTQRLETLAGKSATAIINKTTFENFQIEIPTFVEQLAIAKVLSRIDQFIELEITGLEMLRQQKKGLMQQLLTGKIRVKV